MFARLLDRFMGSAAHPARITPTLPVPPNKTLCLYMKSGSVIEVEGVEEWEGKYAGNEITSLMISQRTPRGGERLLVKSVDLAQIEAITEIVS